MTLKDFIEQLQKLPEEFKDYTVVISKIVRKKDDLTYMHDDPIAGLLVAEEDEIRFIGASQKEDFDQFIAENVEKSENETAS